MLFLVVAADHRRQRFAELAHRHIGDEAQAALVDAHQRYLPARQLARDAQHRAVAAHHHGQVAALAHVLRLQCFEIGDAGGQRGLTLERDLQPLVDQEVGDLLQHGADASCLVLANDHRVFEACSHENDYTIAP